MDRSEKQKLIGHIIAQAMNDAGMSQTQLALELGVSRKTVYNWLNGIKCPSFIDILDAFDAMSINPDAYFKMYVYGNIDVKEDRELDRALMKAVRGLSTTEKRDILFAITGNHGSSFYCITQEMLCQLKSPMFMRQSICGQVIANYEFAEKTGAIVCPDSIAPDMDALKNAYEAGRIAAMNGLHGYTVKKGKR